MEDFISYDHNEESEQGISSMSEIDIDTLNEEVELDRVDFETLLEEIRI
ncbi:MAG: hypothetical protein K5665_03410 [Saccharofermentans sp.]|nr:hypothetical protein [Saccharofermentans sp.]